MGKPLGMWPKKRGPMNEAASFQGADTFINEYNRWRCIYASVGKPPRDASHWGKDALWLRDGYPYPDWSAFVIVRSGQGFDLLSVSTERRTYPVTSHQGFFSQFEDAGKCVIAAVGDYLRLARRMDAVSWTWEDHGLSADVEEIVTSGGKITYRLRDRPDVYRVMASGDRGYSHVMPLSYNELNQILLDGFPDETKALS